MAAVLFATLILNCFIFSLIFWALTFAAKLTYSNKYSNHKYNFYECGFKHTSKATPAYEVNYLLVILFVLIYDGEFLILLPLALNRHLANTWEFYAVSSVFILWIILALVYDYSFKALDWQVVFSFTISKKASTPKPKKHLDIVFRNLKASTELNSYSIYWHVVAKPLPSLIKKQIKKWLTFTRFFS